MNKILTFDCYGTLFDTKPLYDLIGTIAEESKLSSAKAKTTFSAYEDRLMYGEEFQPYDKLLYEVLTYCDMELECDIFVPRYEEVIGVHKNFQPFADVENSLYRLKEKGFELALMSNTTNALMEYHLQKLNNIFDDILVADETRCYKPALAFFAQAEKKFALSSKEHCHIAKGYWWDIVPAGKMGWQCIWVNRMHLLKGRQQETPMAEVFSLEELPFLRK